MALEASYRNPRYTYRHLLREAGASAISLVNGSFLAGSPKDRLFDERIGLPCQITASADGLELRIDQAASRRPITISRIIIPKGHNLHTHQLRLEAWIDDSVSPWTGGESLLGGMLSDPDVVEDFTLRDVLIPGDLQIDLNTNGKISDLIPRGYRYFRLIFQGTANLDVVDLPELFVSETVQTTTGVVRAWEDQVAPGVTRLTTRAGRTYAIQSADRPRRQFTIRHNAVANTDVEVYDDLLREIGHGLRPFYFDPPASGTQRRLAMDDSTGWSATPGGTSVVMAPGHGAGNSIQLAIDDGTSGEKSLFFTGGLFNPAEDWRNMVLEFDFWTNDPDFALDDDLRIALLSDPNSEGAGGRSYGTAFLNSGRGGEFNRFQADLDGLFDASAQPVQGYQPHRTSDLVFSVTKNVAATQRLYRFDKVVLRAKDAAAVYVELVDYERRQSGLNPSREISYDYRLELVEKLP